MKINDLPAPAGGGPWAPEQAERCRLPQRGGAAALEHQPHRRGRGRGGEGGMLAVGERIEDGLPVAPEIDLAARGERELLDEAADAGDHAQRGAWIEPEGERERRAG